MGNLLQYIHLCQILLDWRICVLFCHFPCAVVLKSISSISIWLSTITKACTKIRMIHIGHKLRLPKINGSVKNVLKNSKVIESYVNINLNIPPINSLVHCIIINLLLRDSFSTSPEVLYPQFDYAFLYSVWLLVQSPGTEPFFCLYPPSYSALTTAGSSISIRLGYSLIWPVFKKNSNIYFPKGNNEKILEYLKWYAMHVWRFVVLEKWLFDITDQIFHFIIIV